MSNEGRALPLIGHLRPQAPPEVGTPTLPRPRCVPTRSCSRVEVRVWFDRDGNYQGEYADLPKLELGEFWNQSNVPVKYYGEW